jgi:hypothetical protein
MPSSLAQLSQLEPLRGQKSFGINSRS